ncbi:MAG: hypothetical protein DRP09_15725 [Candidatus Thorarchaeota archaeon]|nr:MAG: hypothetical protein DRP09_15725 [Candidatus Thorarchaeota archaeon]
MKSIKDLGSIIDRSGGSLNEAKKRFKKDKYDAGFAIGTNDERTIEDEVRDDMESRPRDLKKALAKGYVTKGGEITKKGWKILGDDMSKAEGNALKWMKKTFEGARGEGHGSDNAMIGSFWFNPNDKKQLVELEEGEYVSKGKVIRTASSGGLSDEERIFTRGLNRDFNSGQYSGVSFIEFFEIPEEVMDKL